MLHVIKAFTAIKHVSMYVVKLYTYLSTLVETTQLCPKSLKHEPHNGVCLIFCLNHTITAQPAPGKLTKLWIYTFIKYLMPFLSKHPLTHHFASQQGELLKNLPYHYFFYYIFFYLFFITPLLFFFFFFFFLCLIFSFYFLCILLCVPLFTFNFCILLGRHLST